VIAACLLRTPLALGGRMKKTTKRLHLARQTVRTLDNGSLSAAAGGQISGESGSCTVYSLGCQTTTTTVEIDSIFHCWTDHC